MRYRLLGLMIAFVAALSPARAGEPAWWPGDVAEALTKGGENRPELQKALTSVPPAQRPGMAFLIANMPAKDLTSLRADYLLNNVALAYRARAEVPWGRDIPEDVFLNDVLPYANVDETREDWRREFFEMCLPMIKGCKTPSEAAQKLNVELFKKVNVKYSTKRKAPNQAPKESIAGGTASCTGLSILLSDACRSVCVPARLVGTPLWTNKTGNHTWVEIWDRGWHFTGACEADPAGLDRGWFVGQAAEARKDSFEHAIYAASFRKSSVYFPLVWARNNRDVPAENVTDRYAKPKAKADAVQLAIRVLGVGGTRVVTDVTVTLADDAKVRHEGKSRGETADANDVLTFDVPAGREVVIRAGGVERTVRSGGAGTRQVIDITLAPQPPPMPPDAAKSAEAVKALRAALDTGPTTLATLNDRDFARVPLTKADAAAARELIWKAHAQIIRRERADEVKAKVLKEGKLEMPFEYKTFGTKPAAGWSLWISLHGGGGAPKQVNDKQWENQKKLYQVEEGLYLAPRAPTNTWNLWHEPHIDRLFTRLIEDLVVLEGVNPDRVYLLGYSAGGDGVYQLAPRLADRWAGCAMMAGHPNGVSLLSLRNVPFALQVGAEDAAYNRNKVGREYGDRLAELHRADPQGYPHLVKIHEGMGHWMKLQDRAALPWMAKYTRNPVPDRVVWKQTGTPHERSYWLAVPPEGAKTDTLVTARRDGQTIEITAVEKLPRLLIRLDDRLADLDRPVTVTHAGKTLYTGAPPRTVGTMLKTLLGRGDPRLVFAAEVAVSLSGE